MLGVSRRPKSPAEFVIFQAVNDELAEHYAQKHDLVIVRSDEPFNDFNIQGNEWAAREWSLVGAKPTYYLAQKLQAFDTSKGDALEWAPPEGKQ